MANIGGNITGIVQTKTVSGKNAMGEAVLTWTDAFSQTGWLGMSGGGYQRRTYSAKVEESTHMFLCDYHEGIYALADTDVRMVIKGKVYDVILIDNPDEMNEQLEISLRKAGNLNG